MKKEITRACKLCGKPQQKQKESNHNYNVYDGKSKCECGGSFGFMYKDEADALRKVGESRNDRE